MQASANSLKDGSNTWWISLPTNGTSTPVISGDLIYFGAWHEFSEKEQRGELLDFKTMISLYDSDMDGNIKKEEIPEDILMFNRPEVSEDIQPRWYLRTFFKRFDQNRDGLCDSTEWNSSILLWRSFFVDGGLTALKPDSTGALVPTTILWKVNEKVPEVPSPIYYKNLVYMCKNGGILTCMDSKDGTVYYQERIGASGAYIASPIAANGYIYFPSMNGVVTVIKAGKELDILKQSDMNDRLFATPAVIDNVIYIRTAKSLVAFENLDI
jgi:outer membrane protein assembly factor BamB